MSIFFDAQKQIALDKRARLSYYLFLQVRLFCVCKYRKT